ncbi:cell surface protein precursor [Vagococcus fluvialis bH819]|uniref:Cell surface protein n=1 Tax=Vagococcus fluvialis bH819 TaxID=1255619 RepID=A0A1X8XKY6_9ENTE|nr:cell surface protein precursor [Vagococcus fluvialis bH819]
MSPNMSQDIYIEVTNHSNEDIIVVPSISNATTNMNGVVEYMKSKNNVNKDTPLEIEKVVRIDKKQKELKISKGKSQQLKLAITLPKEEFKGIIAGGITLQEKIADESESNKKKNLKIENLHAYTIALVIREDVKELIPNLEFKEVKAGQSNYRNVIFTELINPVSNYVNNLEIKTKIFNKEKKEIYFTE